MRTFFVVSFLIFQLGMIVHARFSPWRYYCWAPHDEQTLYRIDVNLQGRWTSQEEVTKRYRDPWRGINPRAASHVIGLVRQYELTYGKHDHAKVIIRYQTNGMSR